MLFGMELFGKHRILLQRDQIVLVHMRRIGGLRMNDEATEHPDHFLHGHMGVIEEGAVLMQRVLVNEALSRHDQLLAHPRHAVHFNREFKPVPVNAGRLRQMVVEDDTDAVSLVRLNRRSRRAAVEAPQIESSAGDDDLLHGLGDEIEDLDAVVHRERQVAHVERGDGHGSAGTARCRAGRHAHIRGRLGSCRMLHVPVLHVHLAHAALCRFRLLCRQQAAPREHGGAQ